MELKELEKRQKLLLIDLNDLGKNHFSTLRDLCLGYDPYLGTAAL